MSTSAMLVPEKLLTHLNAALRRLLTASDVLCDSNVYKELEPMMRRLLLAEVMGTHAVIAIGGSQGAGKTTILNRLYGLNVDGTDSQWLVPNEGRGETSPVLIEEESGCTHPEGIIRKLDRKDDRKEYEIKDEASGQEKFRSALSQLEPGQLLPILKVPRQFFHGSRQGWLLLPGYETMNRKNRIWQSLMRQGLVAATACVIVTDQARMASEAETAIVRDMLKSDLDGAHVCIVVTKTESLHGKPEDQEALRRRASEIFGVEENRVICTGTTDEDYVAEWLPQLKNLVRQVAASGAGNRKKQIRQLADILKNDLPDALSGIREKARIFSYEKQSKTSGPNATVLLCLEEFKNAADDLREKYTRSIQQVLEAHRAEAWKHLDPVLKEKEGLWNAIKNVFVGVDQRAEEQALEEAWQAPGSVLEEYADILGGLTRKALGAPKGIAVPAPGANALLGFRLGYLDSNSGDAKVIEWAKPTESDTRNLEILFGKADGEPDKALQRSVSLLPALTLEFARLASLKPEIVGVSALDLKEIPDDIRMQEIQKSTAALNETLGHGKVLGKTVIGLFATEGLLALGTAGGVVAGAVAVGPLAYYALQGVHRTDAKRRTQAFQALQAVRDEYRSHFLDYFDRMIDEARAALLTALRARYDLDTGLMECDRLEKALADVRALRGELLETFNHSGDTVDLFNEPPETDDLRGEPS